MIVDDEKLILNGLESIIDWEKIGLCVQHRALDGVEALEKFQGDPVDIVITDITMPKMNGLQLIENIKENYPKTKFIILSGYDDFQYAKKAIALGIENYILKPINEEELESTLISAKDRIRREEEKLQMANKDYETIKQNLYTRWLTNSISDFELEAREFVLDISLKHKFYSAVMIKMQKNEDQVPQNNHMLEYLKNNITDEQTVVFNDLENNPLIIHGWDEEAENLSTLYTSLNGFVKYAKDELNQNVFVTIGEPQYSCENLYKSFEVAKGLQEYLLMYGYNTVVSTSKIMDNNKCKEHELGIDLDEFNKVLLGKDKKKIETFINDISKILKSKDSVTPDIIKNFFISMMFILRKTTHELNITKEKDYDNLRDIIDQVCGKETIEDIKEFMKEECFKVLDIMRNNTYEFSPVVQEILSYVDNHYNEEMSLKILAHKYNMNSAYLGQVFSKEVGSSFSEYLNQIKNEKAKEMLLNTNLRINDIAKKVGYEDTSYFYRKFKKYYGVGPSAIRKSKVIG